MKRMRGTLVLTTATALIAMALPALANAKDYCVGAAAGCVGPPVSFQDALKQAILDTAPDRIFLGPGEHAAPTANGFLYGGVDQLEIIGAGRDKTTLTAPLSDGVVLSLNAGPGSSVHDLTIKVPPLADGNFSLHSNSTVRRVLVTEDAPSSKKRGGVQLALGGRLEDSEVSLDRGGDTTAVIVSVGGGAVTDSTLSASKGAWIVHGDADIERSTITGREYGVRAMGTGTTIRSSLIDLKGNYGTGLAVDTSLALGTDTTVEADGVTILTPYVPDVVGVAAMTSADPAHSARIDLTNSVIRGGGGSLFAYTPTGGLGDATVAAFYSDYDPSYNNPWGDRAHITEAKVSYVGDAGFVDPAGGNYHLLPSSKLVDRGDPATPQGLDLDGNALLFDGDGDGFARRDLGAYELQGTPGGGQPGGGQPGGGPAPDTLAPRVSGFRASPAVFRIARARSPVAARAARGTRLRYALSEPARVTVAIKRAVERRGHVRYRTVGTLRRTGAQGANAIRFTGRIGKRALRPGRYRAVLRASDAAGNRSARKTIRLRIAPSGN